MTINELFLLCKNEIKNGNGEKQIILYIDDDSFYPLENKFSSLVYNSNKIYDLINEEDKDQFIVLN